VKNNILILIASFVFICAGCAEESDIATPVVGGPSTGLEASPCDGGCACSEGSKCEGSSCKGEEGEACKCTEGSACKCEGECACEAAACTKCEGEECKCTEGAECKCEGECACESKSEAVTLDTAQEVAQ